jgi:hypothetical protein
MHPLARRHAVKFSIARKRDASGSSPMCQNELHRSVNRLRSSTLVRLHILNWSTRRAVQPATRSILRIVRVQPATRRCSFSHETLFIQLRNAVQPATKIIMPHLVETKRSAAWRGVALHSCVYARGYRVVEVDTN